MTIAHKPIDEIELPGGGTLLIRAASAEDADAVVRFYDSMSIDDTRSRFFSASMPPHDWFAKWTSISNRGGFSAVALLREPRPENADDGTVTNESVIGEAGYSLLPDGDGELAIAVAKPWRGWLGPYLLDVLVQQAAAAGIQNLQAEVLLGNRPMLNLLQRRGAVTRELSVGETRLSIATNGHVPTWPPNDRRRRLLVEVPGGRWTGARFVDGSELQLAMCSGPSHRPGGCPELCDGTCPLVDGADAIAMLLDHDEPVTSDLLDLHRERHPDVPLFVRHSVEASDHGLAADPSAAVAAIAASVVGDSNDR